MILGILFIVLILFFCQYLCCIPLNWHSAGFLFELMIVLLIAYLSVVGYSPDTKDKKKILKLSYFPIIVIAAFLILILIGTPYTGGLHNYKGQSKIKESDFSEIPQFDATQVQLVDKDTAQQLGDRVFGTLGSDEVSQYAVGDDWVQISMNGRLYRVTPIDFGGLYRYFVTKQTPGYIVVDCYSGEAKLVRSEGLKYMKSAYFSQNLHRHLFFNDPFAILGSPKFELDDEGRPFWVTPVLNVTWVGKTRDVKGIYVTDPTNGQDTYYAKADVPSWVDNVYPISVIYDQFRQTKRYENGLFNWAKKGIVEFTDDYAYVQFDDDVHIYTGVTSVGKDESNVGFAYVDLKSGEISYIRRAGAEEYSARSSAEGALQQYHYTAIFPSMVNVSGRPTYFMGLVDGANLIKSYAFVSYENYQLVATGQTVDEAYNNYLRLTSADGRDDADTSEMTITVEDIEMVVRDGNTLVVIQDPDGSIFHYSMADGDLRMSFVKQGDTLKVLSDQEGRIRQLLSLQHAE